MEGGFRDVRHEMQVHYENQAIYISIALMVAHALSLAYFVIRGFDILSIYSIMDLIICCIDFVLLKKNGIRTYIYVLYVDNLIFMCLAIISLGWDYGFQMFFFTFIAVLLITEFDTKAKGGSLKRLIYFAVINIMILVTLKLYCNSNPPIYDYTTDFEKMVSCVFSIIQAMGFTVAYIAVYCAAIMKLDKELGDIANRDTLTGMRNRRRMLELMDETDAEYPTIRVDAGVAMLDIDKFKIINDTYGHDVGDEVLMALSEILLNRFRNVPGIHVCRWGGEEFIFLFRRLERSRSWVVDEMEKLRHEIEATEVDTSAGKLSFTITVGLAFGAGGTHCEELVKAADDKLYDGKIRGRNIVVW